MSHLTLAIEDRVATVTFDNPPLQVMTPSTVHEIADMLPRLDEDDVGAVVFTGADSDYFIRHFSVEELDASARGDGTKWAVNMDDVLLRVEHFPKPVICALNGTAMGGGLEFALAMDIRVAKDGPFRFGLPEVSVGILPGGGGTQRLPAQVGRGRALEMMLRARLVTPSEAHAYGLVEELVPAETAESALERAQAIAAEIALRPPLAVAHIKRLTREAVSPVTKDMLTLESRLFAELMRTPEAQALMQAVAAQHRVLREDDLP
ncbi:MAG: enoyl-CoA hydratase/isomerase family protein [Alphaproteobacteria bacterium]